MANHIKGKYIRKNNPLYGIWNQIRHRCLNPKNSSYPRYGGRGVTVCNAWLNDFDAFADWAMEQGWKPGMQIDKDIKSRQLNIDPPRYSPETCQLVTPRVNNLNSSATKFTEAEVSAIVTLYESAEDTFQHRRNVEKTFNLTGKQLGCILARRAKKQLGRGKAGVLTNAMKIRILELRALGFPFKKVAEFVGIKYNTCKSWHAKYMRGEDNVV